MPPIFLTLEEILAIHRDQIARYGGIEGVRDWGLLHSAVAMPAAVRAEPDSSVARNTFLTGPNRGKNRWRLSR